MQPWKPLAVLCMWMILTAIRKKCSFSINGWMPSNEAKKDWIRRVRDLDIDIMAPQHGRLFKGDDVKRFLDWFEDLDVGIAIHGS